VRLGLAGRVALMSGTNRDENNLFMARNSRGRRSHLSTALHIPSVIIYREYTGRREKNGNDVNVRGQARMPNVPTRAELEQRVGGMLGGGDGGSPSPPVVIVAPPPPCSFLGGDRSIAGHH
jgi:hypothetical protein